MKKALFIAIFSMFSVSFLFASNGGGAAVFTETAEEAKLKEVAVILTGVNASIKALGDVVQREQGAARGSIRQNLKVSVEKTLNVFYESCKNLFPFLNDSRCTVKFKALVSVAKRYINNTGNRDLSKAYDYSHNIYSCVLKLLPCLKEFEDKGRKSPSKKCLGELNTLILGLDEAIVSPLSKDEDTPVPFMAIISPIKQQIHENDFSSDCAANLSSEFEELLAERDIKTGNTNDTVKVDLNEQFDLVEGVREEGMTTSEEWKEVKDGMKKELDCIYSEWKAVHQASLDAYFQRTEQEIEENKLRSEQTANSQKRLRQELDEEQNQKERIEAELQTELKRQENIKGMQAEELLQRTDQVAEQRDEIQRQKEELDRQKN